MQKVFTPHAGLLCSGAGRTAKAPGRKRERFDRILYSTRDSRHRGYCQMLLPSRQWRCHLRVPLRARAQGGQAAGQPRRGTTKPATSEGGPDHLARDPEAGWGALPETRPSPRPRIHLGAARGGDRIRGRRGQDRTWLGCEMAAAAVSGAKRSLRNELRQRLRAMSAEERLRQSRVLTQKVRDRL
ncbi:hypothetical protein P7K49_013045 [Saguinus oedipus]|uniref:Uncharacterized protein n=1 Tax=Saguinus oedipus TaxID=9490 RepID=A0ABQ9VFM9_SAGOE|nr:hypothetical protein P7K49_013045 [Saguinus oedipus]